jgi:hypothetical protein
MDAVRDDGRKGKDTMKHEPLVSDSLLSYGYDEQTKELNVTFKKSGVTYRYKGVPPRVAAGLGTADSAGKYFRDFVKPHYCYERLPK